MKKFLTGVVSGGNCGYIGCPFTRCCRKNRGAIVEAWDKAKRDSPVL